MIKISYIMSLLGDEISSAINKLDKDVLSRITEIRIRKNNFIILIFKNTALFIDGEGELKEHPDNMCVKASAEYVDKLFLRMCEYSIYANEDNIRNGFITLQNGSRVGISGTAVMINGVLSSLKDVRSLNIRIPNEVRGCSNDVLNCLYVNSFPSVIVAGAPSSGKTTLLRDMAYQLSNGFNDRYKKVVLVDERNEFAGKTGGEFALKTGVNTDVLSSFPKNTGIEIATRTLSPDMIVCDEISKESEVEAITSGFSSGISFALSVHVGSKDDIYKKKIIRKLLETGEFSYIVLLCAATYKTEILDAEEVLREISRLHCSSDFDKLRGAYDV